MQPRPLSNKPQRGLGGDIPDDHAPVQVELAVLALVLGVEVLRIVLPIKHPNDDSEENRDDRHVAEYTVVVRR